MLSNKQYNTGYASMHILHETIGVHIQNTCRVIFNNLEAEDFKKLKGFSILAGKYNHERVTNLDLHNLNNLHCDFIVQKNSNKPFGFDNPINKYIYTQLEQLNKPILVRENPSLRAVGNGNPMRRILDDTWCSLSWNHWFMDEGIYPYDDTYDRWTELSSKYNHLNVHNWCRRGDNILLLCQVDSGGSSISRLNYNNIDYKHYIADVIIKIKKISDRPLVVRLHPKDNTLKKYLDTLFDNIIYSNKTLYEDLNRAWCAVTYNSTACVEASLYGTPTIVLDSSAISTPVSQTSLEQIEDNWEPCREQWLKKIAFMQWEGKELHDEYVWKLLKAVMPTHGPKIN